MKKLIAILFSATLFAACGSGDTGEGYPADRTGLNPNATNIDTTLNNEAGMRGNPDSTVGATVPEGAGSGAGSRPKGPDSNATNPNVQGGQ